jgi:hypothetical protein
MILEKPAGEPQLRRARRRHCSGCPRVRGFHRKRSILGAHHEPLLGEEFNELIAVLEATPQEVSDEDDHRARARRGVSLPLDRLPLADQGRETTYESICAMRSSWKVNTSL